MLEGSRGCLSPGVDDVTTTAGIGSGHGEVPLKWPQKPFASIAYLKCKVNTAQFTPEGSSLGTEDGRESDSEVVVVDMSCMRAKKM